MGNFHIPYTIQRGERFTSLAAQQNALEYPHLVADPDYTWFTRQHPVRQIRDHAESSVDDSIAVQDFTKAMEKKEARLCVASCYAGRAWSFNVRWSPKKPLHAGPWKYDCSNPLDSSKYMPASGYSQGMLSINDICVPLSDRIIRRTGAILSGLVVVAGETNCCKSLITRGLIFKYLSGDRAWKRKPHLVTIEDPIEEYFFGELDASKLNDLPINYTPRLLGTDVEDLEQALLGDALRQTPALVYVGETRSAGDWKTILEFATTGHLVVTTAHAGSLTETMDRIMGAVRAHTPAQRAELANRIVALVHLRRVEVDIPGLQAAAVIPALWRATDQGIHAFVSDGLSALLPRSDADDTESNFGRSWFCGASNFKFSELKNSWSVAARAESRLAPLAAQAKLAWAEIRRQALSCDLEGK